MGDLINSIFSNVGGNAAKRDRAEELNSYGSLRNIINWALPTAQKESAQGMADTRAGITDMGQSNQLFKKLAAGSRSDVLSAVAPEAAGIRAASDASRRELASSGTARGGGTAGVNQARDAANEAQLNNLVFGVRPQAAKESADIATRQAQIGLGQEDIGNRTAQVGEMSAFDLGKLAATNRPVNQDIHQKSVDQLSSGFEDLLAMVFDPGSIMGKVKGG
jgi:hypothetical protein